MNRYMIYNFNTHSINLEKRYEGPTVSLTIDTLELVIDYLTREVLYVQGFLPLVKAVNSKITLPEAQKGNYCLNCIDFSDVDKFDVFSLSNKVPKSKKYFEKHSIVFDKENGIIQLGCTENKNCSYVRIDDNLILGQDNESIIQCFYIIPDKFL